MKPPALERYLDDREQECYEVVEDLINLEPTSREDLKQQVAELLAGEDLQVIDTHNTNSIIYIFTDAGQRYGLKIEYGDEQESKVTRDEAHWYNKVPEHLREHFVRSEIRENMAFVLLRWFDDAPTIEQMAAAGDPTTMDRYLEALHQNEQLFDRPDTRPLETTAEKSFFKDKFYAELDRVRRSPNSDYLSGMLTSEQVTLNGVVTAGPATIIERIHQNDRLRDYLSPHVEGFIHGDMHADNLIAADGKVYMIDPNGKDYLPLEYDHGRILWSMTGWNQIVKHQHTLEVQGDHQYQLEVPVHQQYVDGMGRIKDHLEEYGAKAGLEPGQAYHRALYSSAMQYLSRGTHVGVPHEALGLHLRGLEQLGDLCRQLEAAGIIDDAQALVSV